MKIEHWQSRADHPGKQLDYRNLLGTCMGGEGKPFSDQHCDTRKGDNELSKNPANPEHAIEALVRYDPDGTIWSNDSMFDNQLNQILNLNLFRLKEHRKSVFDSALEWWRKEKRHGPVLRQKIEREINKRLTLGGMLAPYCQVAVWFLNRKLERML